MNTARVHPFALIMSLPKSSALLALSALLAACHAQTGRDPNSRSAPSARPLESAGSTSSSASTPSPVSSASPDSVLAQWNGHHGGHAQFAVQVLRTAAEWEGFWRQVQRNSPRPLDPAREMAVVVFLGERRTGGYRVEIAGVQPRDGALVVSYRETTPAPDMMVTQALTAPWAVAIVPRSDLPVSARKLGSTGERKRA